MKKILASILVLAFALCLVGCDVIDKFLGNADTSVDVEKAEKYERAMALLNEKEYEEAYAIFTELGDYSDSAMHLSRFHCIPIAASEYSSTSYDGEKVFGFLEFNEINLPVKVVLRDVKGEILGSISFFYNEEYKILKRLEDYQDSISTVEYEYDENGLLCKKTNKNDEGSITRKYSYDERGNLTESILTSMSGEWYKDTYTYDSRNNMTGHRFELFNGYGNSYAYEYDDYGNMIRNVFCSDLSGTPSQIYEYIYDASGRILRCISVDPNGYSSDPFWIKKYTYDENGRLVKITNSYPASTSVTTVDYSYYGNGNLYKILSTQNNNGELVSQESHTYSYDNSNRITKEVHETTERTISTRYSYDKYGNIAEVVTENSEFNNRSSASINYQLMYFPFDMSDEEFHDRFIVDVLGLDITIEYPEY